MNKPIPEVAKRLLMAAIPGLVLLGPPACWAQSTGADAKKQIVGVWRLLSTVNTSKEGVVTKDPSFGPNPSGRFIFTESGHYASINTNPSIPKFASGNRRQGTPEENQAVVRGSIAQFGTYTVAPDGKVLTLKVEGSTWAHWVGTEQKRNLTLSGDDMKYTVVSSIGGTSELTYKRIK